MKRFGLIVSFMVGCSSSVDVPSAGSAGASSSAASSTGAGGGGGSGGGFVCPPGMFIDIEGDGPKARHLLGACVTWVPAPSKTPEVTNGRIIYVSESLHQELLLDGCGEASGQSIPAIVLQADLTAEGTTAGDYVRYTSSDGTKYEESQMAVSVTKLGAVGEKIDGRFEVSLSDALSGKKLDLTGTFSVCRGPDGPPLP